MTATTDAYPYPNPCADRRPWRGRRRRIAAAALAAAAAAATITVPLSAAPALAAATPPPVPPACGEALPYRASASADLLRLDALDLRPLGIGLGPAVEIRIASTSAGMAADAEVASAAAARDVAANLLGLDAIGLLPGTGLGHTVFQQAPPTNPEPATGPGTGLDVGVLRADLATTSAHATCGAGTDAAGTASAGLVDAAVLPSRDGQALVSLPASLSSRAGTGLVEHNGVPASRAVAAASLTDLRLFAGSGSEIAVRVLSEPELVAISSGASPGGSVRYHAPVLEISGPGIGTAQLDTPGTHLDLVVPGAGKLPESYGLPVLGGGRPLDELLAGWDPGLLGQLTAGPDQLDRPLELPDLPDLPGLAGAAGLPPANQILAGTGELTILRLSIGDLQETVTGGAVTAAAVSLRLQLLSWDASGGTGYGVGPAERAGGGASAVLDLSIGLLEVAATAPPPPEGPQPGQPPQPTEPGQPGAGGECGECPEGLPVTGSTVGIVAGTGVLLLLAGRFLLLLTRSGRLTSRA